MVTNLNYGIIGNCRSAALVSESGSIDWCCLPDLDSPSLFARIIDEDKGGHFGIVPVGEYRISQKYITNTNILVTSFVNEIDAFEVVDFMPRYNTGENNYFNAPEIYRIIRVLYGKPVIITDYDPKPNYASSPVVHEIQHDFIKSYTVKGRYESVYLYTSLDKNMIAGKKQITLTGESFFVLSYNQKLIDINVHRANLEYERTLVYWLNWSNRARIFPRFHQEILRSALVLKLLTFQKTGAIIAAITTSIPEALGEKRNWDYRYCWIRDSSMIIKTLLSTGHYKSAERFLNFLLSVNEGKHEDIRIMYGIRGEKKLEEKILHHLKGYKNCKPVRKGNSAYIQKQNDIYGILIDAIYLSISKFPATLDTAEELWTFVRGMIAMVTENWEKPDRGIWEIRKESRHFVFSKVLSWVALDRGCKIARIVGKHDYEQEWSILKGKIKDDIYRNGWDPDLKAFTQSYGSKSLDASLLLIEDYGFIEASDPMFVSTVLAIRDNLSEDGMMFRYKNEDDFGKPHNSLIICTFWLIDALCKIGLNCEAEALFEKMLKSANHLGLFSEHINVKTGELLGNFPQGYSHIGLIKAALTINGIKADRGNEQFIFKKP
jgi:GH15 family glucan-1,4-alpha-glucosidase